MSRTPHVAVCGSGPAGLAAAYNASLNGAQVTLFEQMPRCGLKLLASGGAKCNVTNALELEQFAQKFGRQWRFLLPALKKFHGRELLDFFMLNNVPLVKEDGFHYFPKSGRAKDVLDMWLDMLKCNKVNIQTSTRLERIEYDGNGISSVIAGAVKYPVDALVLACGGKSYPALGGRGGGYAIAESAGHKITALYPGMTGIDVSETWVHSCAGISLADCTAYLDHKSCRSNLQRGELLFTHTGFSAFAVLDLAANAAALLEKEKHLELVIDFVPNISEKELFEIISLWRIRCGKKSVLNLLSEYLPRKLASFLLNGRDEIAAAQFSGADARALVGSLKQHRFSVCGTGKWDKAMVTSGGVSLKNIDPETLGSRLVPGLFFAGELLDVTGPCGGYNITWAFASGMLAGLSASRV